ncbi:_IS4 [Hexamita inflata]|uniref:IS4 n=1 Tax=Hexamita inflata TaxID=28002 RepID=A0AA86QRA0_9EUKA|nr:IS4 [Hexamita inflata]
MIGDKGYQGMQKVNAHFLLPIKEKQGGLSQAEKNFNTSFSKVRLVVEHTYMRLKECYKAFSQVWTLRRSKLEDMVVFAIGIQNYMTTKNPMLLHSIQQKHKYLQGKYRVSELMIQHKLIIIMNEIKNLFLYIQMTQ